MLNSNFITIIIILFLLSLITISLKWHNSWNCHAFDLSWITFNKIEKKVREVNYSIYHNWLVTLPSLGWVESIHGKNSIRIGFVCVHCNNNKINLNLTKYGPLFFLYVNPCVVTGWDIPETENFHKWYNSKMLTIVSPLFTTSIIKAFQNLVIFYISSSSLELLNSVELNVLHNDCDYNEIENLERLLCI